MLMELVVGWPDERRKTNHTFNGLHHIDYFPNLWKARTMGSIQHTKKTKMMSKKKKNGCLIVAMSQTEFWLFANDKKPCHHTQKAILQVTATGITTLTATITCTATEWNNADQRALDWRFMNQEWHKMFEENRVLKEFCSSELSKSRW